MRYDFGGDGTQAVIDVTTGGLLRGATDGIVYPSLDSETALVDITSDEAGTTFIDNVTTDANGIPRRFYGPDGVQQLVVAFGDTRFLLDSNRGRKEALQAGAKADAASAAADAASATAGNASAVAQAAAATAQQAMDAVGGSDGAAALTIAQEARTTAEQALTTAQASAQGRTELILQVGSGYPPRTPGFTYARYIGSVDPESTAVDGDEWIQVFT